MGLLQVYRSSKSSFLSLLSLRTFDLPRLNIPLLTHFPTCTEPPSLLVQPPLGHGLGRADQPVERARRLQRRQGEQRGAVGADEAGARRFHDALAHEHPGLLLRNLVYRCYPNKETLLSTIDPYSQYISHHSKEHPTIYCRSLLTRAQHLLPSKGRHLPG